MVCVCPDWFLGVSCKENHAQLSTPIYRYLDPKAQKMHHHHFYNLFRVMLHAPTIQQKFYKVWQTFIPLGPHRNTKRKELVKLFRLSILFRIIISLHCIINVRFTLYTKQKCTTLYIFAKGVQYCTHLFSVECKSYIDSSM